MNNLYLINSDIEEQINFTLTELLNKIDFSEDNKIIYDLTISTFTDILDEASTLSLFAGSKVIIGTNFDQTKLSDAEIDYLSKYVTNQNKSSFIFLTTNKIDSRRSSYKIFKDNFKIIEASNPNKEEDLVKYIKKKLTEEKYKMNDSTISYFLSKTGKDIFNINNELDKLIIYKGEDKLITISDIELLITDNIDNIIYEFTNAILEEDIDTIIKMYHNFKLENVSFDYLITSIANSFRQALIIKMMYNDHESIQNIAKKIGKKEFYVKKMLERIYKYTESDLASYINKLALIDRNFKSGKSNTDELELFLINK